MTKRIDALTGLRGVAVLAVLFHHAGILPQGWIGVDLFFVLSGYLITTILLKEQAQPHFWKKFYVRRATRILPVFLLVLGILGALGFVPQGLWPYFLLSGANIAVATHFGQVSNAIAMLWSLSVEEHFYFIWPFAVLKLTPSTLGKILVAVIVLEPLLRVTALHYGIGSQYTYYLTPFRLDGLALGSMLALTIGVVTRAQALYASLATCLGVALAWKWLILGQHQLFADAVGYSLVALCACSLIAFVIKDRTGLVPRLLSLKPLVFIGEVSYGLYLIHVLVFMAVVHIAARAGFNHGKIEQLLAVPFAIALAWFSYRYFETPFLTLGKRHVAGWSEERIIDQRSR